MADAEKIPIAMISNSMPPYRVHVHRRVVREMKELQVSTLRTHIEDERWLSISQRDADEIGMISFGQVSCWDQGRLKYWRREWSVGGKLIEWIGAHGVRAVVLVGYNDPGRLRLLLWCKRRGIPVFIWGDSNIADENTNLRGHPFKATLKKLIVPRLLGLGAGAFSFGTAGKEYFGKYGVGADRIFFFPLEPDYQAIRALSPRIIAGARDRFGLAQDRRRFLFCGRMIPIKRPELLVEAFCAIAQRRPTWDLIMLGDGPMRAEIESRTPPLMRQRVIWTGHVPDQDIVRGVQRSCDVLVLPSDREPWALVINEALAGGLAIVSTTIAGAAVDLVRDGVNGYTFAPGDRPALESRLLDASEESQLAALRAMAAPTLADWIRKADPVAGLRKALAAVGVLPQPH
ncbi:MAG TPA: glycosyltransferase family 4 protein [Tepidisphaeraceae bacterium]|jgi:glycosyltransferase involved in cell wall biosynthesis|nr:glycosyltransferase family 4 protein [Tepidisphaeraceae bacterium]